MGVVRFFLILFYDNYLSLRSSVITLVSSRFGDVCLFMLVALGSYVSKKFIFGLIYFFFIVFTKRAGFPFISWLLEAMRAPTPVRSLVHSSTLVAAGVWFMLRYDYSCYFETSPTIRLLLLLTIFITGVSSFFFLDLKKVVALSTCNNISWCLFYLIFGSPVLCLLQLVRHGVSKCMLFMLVGDVMSGSGGSQGGNCVYPPRLYSNYGVFRLVSVVLGLSGVPFIGVFFTKHFLLSGFISNLNIGLLIFLYICVFLSYYYSFRLCCVLLNIKGGIVSGCLYLFFTGAVIYFWLFSKFFMFLTLEESVSLSVKGRMLLLSLQLISVAIALYFYDSDTLSAIRSRLFGCDNLVEAVYKLFVLVSNKIFLFLYR